MAKDLWKRIYMYMCIYIYIYIDYLAVYLRLIQHCQSTSTSVKNKRDSGREELGLSMHKFFSGFFNKW